MWPNLFVWSEPPRVSLPGQNVASMTLCASRLQDLKCLHACLGTSSYFA